MKLKIGDKVYCKKQMNESDNIWFYRDKYYKIVAVGIGSRCRWVNIASEVEEYPTVMIPISFTIKGPVGSSYYFDEYFITIKELRKKKLDKLM